LLAATCLISGLLTSCKCDDDPRITYFAFEELHPIIVAEIDQSQQTIEAEVPDSIDVTHLSPTIRVINPGCMSVSPSSNTSQDFSSPVAYEVSNEKDDVVQYEVSVFRKQPSPDSIHMIWNFGNDAPAAIGWSASAVLENKLYVIGGVGMEGISRAVYVYDPETDTWTTDVNPIQYPRWGHSATIIDGKIYVMGGADEAPRDTTPISIIEVFDPSSGTWSPGGEMTKARIGHEALAYQGKIYIMGGEYEEPSLTTLRSVEAYDPGNQTWESLELMPSSRIFMASFIMGDTIYLLGGGSKYPYAGLKSIEAYIIFENRWEKKANLKIGLGDLDACVIDGRIFCAGGWAIYGDIGNNTVQVYNPKSNTVQLTDEMNVARFATVTLSYNGKIYVIGGMQTFNPEPLFTNKTEIGTPEL
jgi:N-acetylneuraminic acid mutarotase